MKIFTRSWRLPLVGTTVVLSQKKQAMPHTVKAHTLDEALGFAQSVSNRAVAVVAQNQCGAHPGASPTVPQLPRTKDNQTVYKD